MLLMLTVCRKTKQTGNKAGHAEVELHFNDSDMHSALACPTMLFTRRVLYYARYLGLGMRYEAGICTVVISMR